MSPFPPKDALKVREASLADATAVARVHVEAWRETYQGLIPQTVLDDLSYAEGEARWSSVLRRGSESEFVFVAESAGEVCGFASGGRERSGHADFKGELFAIYLLRSFQRRGAGRLMFDAVRGRLVELGYDSMLVWVLERNPACGFYRAMGGHRAGQKDVHFGDAVLSEVAYGFG